MKAHKAKGFTLIELVMVIVITAIVGSIAGIALRSGFSGYFTGVSLNSLNSKGNIAMMRMTEELRTAISFSSINTNSVSFTTTDGTTISYSLSGTTLNRAENGGSNSILCTEVNIATFAYYTSNQTVTATPDSVRAVTISMTLQANSNSLPLINTVYLRSMG